MSNQGQYSEQQVLNALAAVKNGKSISLASKLYGIPRTTLSDKHHGKVPIERKMGPTTILSKEEESQLIQWMLDVAAMGFPVTKDQLIDSVQLLLIELEKSSLFPHGKPGRAWYEAFLKRHPEISKRIPQNLTKSRGVITEERLRGWFEEVSDYFVSNNIDSILLEPKRIFNCDETAFFLCPKGAQVLVKRGEKSVYNFINCDERECLTTLVTGNAMGDLAPPMIIYSYQRVPADIAASIPKTWGLGKSNNGWMTGETFYECISNIFYPWLLREKIPLPVVLFLDGHSSHLTMSVSNFCREHQIVLVALHPNATHILQPMDVSVFSPLKKEWKKTVYDWRMKNGGERLTRVKFAPLLQSTMDKCNFEQSLQNGFRACGLYPFSPDAIDYTKLLQPRKSSQPEAENVKEYLDFLEKNLPSTKLELFKSAGLMWSGNVEDKSLFDFWLSLKTRVGDIEDNLTDRLLIENNAVENSRDDQESLKELEIPENEVINMPFDVINHRSFEDIDAMILGIDDNEQVTYSSSLHSAPSGIISRNNHLILDETGTFDNEAPIVITVENHFQSSCSTVPLETLTAEVNSIRNAEISIVSNPDQTQSEESSIDNSQAASNVENHIQNLNTSTENSENNDENNQNISNRRNIPSPFKRALPWPNLEQKGHTSKKRKPKEKLPAVATGEEWVKYHKRKEEQKLLAIVEVEERKKARAEKAEEKRKALETKREEKKKKKAEKEEMRRVAMLIKQEEKNKKQAGKK